MRTAVRNALSLRRGRTKKVLAQKIMESYSSGVAPELVISVVQPIRVKMSYKARKQPGNTRK